MGDFIMKQNIILCFFLTAVSIYAAQGPAEDPWETMTVQEKIDYLTNDIHELNQELEKRWQELVAMKIWIIGRKDGSLEFHCGKISRKPTYTIQNRYQFTGDELIAAMTVCFECNNFDNKQKWAADNLIDAYLRIYKMISLEKRTLNILRQKLNQFKPALRHPTT